MTVLEQGKNAKNTLTFMSQVTTEQKNRALNEIADELEKNIELIIKANKTDLDLGKKNGLSSGLLDRLMLNESRIKAMADGARQVAQLDDPCGKTLYEYEKDNGLVIKKISVAIGVIGIIFEARPNVTVDAAVLCLKSSNSVILRGGKEAFHSNMALTGIMRNAVKNIGFPCDVIQLVSDTTRQSANEMMKMSDYIDCLIPRGGKGLIKAVVQNSTVPVIETGSGNCHIYIDESADIAQAADIVYNAKTQRISVCNACESLVINSKIINEALPVIVEKLKEKNVEIRADERARVVCPFLKEAVEEDFYTEYLDYIISVKTVDTLDEAIEHINRCSTGHSESIITQNKKNVDKFMKCIDSSSVYVNASTRFTDGAEFGLGAEIGISTQKLHARGPMGLEQLTSAKYLIYGNGQIR